MATGGANEASAYASAGYVVQMGRPMATSQDFVNWVCGDQLERLAAGVGDTPDASRCVAIEIAPLDQAKPNELQATLPANRARSQRFEVSGCEFVF